MDKEIETLTKQGHIEKANNNDENCSVSTAVITTKKDKSVKIALDTRKLNDTETANAKYGGTDFKNLKKNGFQILIWILHTVSYYF